MRDSGTKGGRPQGFRGRDLAEFRVVCDPEKALVGGRAHPYYADLSAGRGSCARLERVVRELRALNEVATQTNTDPDPQKILFTGHSGTGKSTELNSLAADLEAAGFLVVRFSATREFNIADIGWSDVLIEMAHQIWEQALAAHQRLLLPLISGSSPIDAVDQYLERTSLIQIIRHEAEMQAHADGELRTPNLLGQLRAAYKNLWKSRSERVREVRRELEPHAADLHAAINTLIGQVQRTLARAKKQGLVVIVDDLEKMADYEAGTASRSSEELFVEHSQDLQSPNCHVIYTVPLGLFYNHNLQDRYSQSEALVLPMVRVRRRDRSVDAEGTELTVGLLRKRAADLDALFDPVARDELVRMSGGHLRDLFRLFRLACNYALDEQEHRVGPTHVRAAVVQFSDSSYYRLAQGALGDLREVFRSQRVGPGQGRLLQNLLVLEYNDGRTWNDIHPCVLELPEVRKELGLDASWQLG